MEGQEEFYTPSEIADKLKVSTDLVKKLCKEGKIPAFKFGGRLWRIPKLAFDEYLRSQQPANTG